MAGPTLGEQVAELKRDLQVLIPRHAVEEAVAKLRMSESEARSSRHETEMQQTRDRLADLAMKITELQGRCTAVEKVSDRHWQVWLALGGAVLALLVSLLKK